MMEKLTIEIEIPKGHTTCAECKIPLCELGVNCEGYDTRNIEITDIK